MSMGLINLENRMFALEDEMQKLLTEVKTRLAKYEEFLSSFEGGTEIVRTAIQDAGLREPEEATSKPEEVDLGLEKGSPKKKKRIRKAIG